MPVKQIAGDKSWNTIESGWRPAGNTNERDSSWQSGKSGGPKERRGSAKIGELRAELDAQQIRTFTRWWNSWLSLVKLKITDLNEDIKPGVYPIRLLEVLSDSSCGKFDKHPKSKFQWLANHNLFLQQLKAKSIKIVNIGPEDLAGTSEDSEESHRKLVLGLTWTLILRYEIQKFGENESELLNWAKQTAGSEGIDVSGGWGTAFADGTAFCSLVHAAEPRAIDLASTERMEPTERLQTAFDAAEEHLGVPKLLEPEDLLCDLRAAGMFAVPCWSG